MIKSYNIIYKIILSLLIFSINCTILHTDSNSHYMVQKGDCLYTISEKYYGNGVNWTNIYQLNADRIRIPDMIYPNQKFILKSVLYKVKKGDSLYKISKELYGTAVFWGKIYKINSRSINNADLIYPDQVLIVPEWQAIPVEPVPAEISEPTQGPPIPVERPVEPESVLPVPGSMPDKPDSSEKLVRQEEKSPEEELISMGITPVRESEELLKNIAIPENFEPVRIIYSHKAKKENLEDFIPPQLSIDDFAEVESSAGVELENKETKYRKIYITICDINRVVKKEEFWDRIKNKIVESEKTMGDVHSFTNARLEGFDFKVAPDDQYTFYKEKEKPEVITILKTKIEYKQDISAFTELFSGRERVLENQKIKDEIFMLPALLPSGYRFLEFYLEKIPPEYVKKKYNAEWGKMIVGKLNLSAVYIDKENTEWSINLFNLENEKEAEKFYDQYFSKDKKEMAEKLKKSKNSSSSDTELLKFLVELTVDFEPVQIGPYKGWWVSNKMRKVEEISFRAFHYVITIAAAKIGQKEVLIELARALQIEKILKDRKMDMPPEKKK